MVWPFFEKLENWLNIFVFFTFLWLIGGNRKVLFDVDDLSSYFVRKLDKFNWNIFHLRLLESLDIQVQQFIKNPFALLLFGYNFYHRFEIVFGNLDLINFFKVINFIRSVELIFTSQLFVFKIIKNFYDFLIIKLLKIFGSNSLKNFFNCFQLFIFFLVFKTFQVFLLQKLVKMIMLKLLFVLCENLIVYFSGCFECKTIQIFDVFSRPFVWWGFYFYKSVDLFREKCSLKVNKVLYARIAFKIRILGFVLHLSAFCMCPSVTSTTFVHCRSRVHVEAYWTPFQLWWMSRTCYQRNHPFWFFKHVYAS